MNRIRSVFHYNLCSWRTANARHEDSASDAAITMVSLSDGMFQTSRLVKFGGAFLKLRFAGRVTLVDASVEQKLSHRNLILVTTSRDILDLHTHADRLLSLLRAASLGLD